MRALLAVVLMGCGAPRLQGAPLPGSDCSPGEPRECMTAESIGLCVDRKWNEWPCAGACANASEPRCALEMPAKAGEPCPPGSVDGGAAACVAAPDGGVSNQVLKCVGGVAVASDCTRCRRDSFLESFVCD